MKRQEGAARSGRDASVSQGLVFPERLEKDVNSQKNQPKQKENVSYSVRER